MISVLLTIAVFAGLIKDTVDFIKDIRRRDEGCRVIEYAQLHGISVSEARRILNHD